MKIWVLMGWCSPFVPHKTIFSIIKFDSEKKDKIFSDHQHDYPNYYFEWIESEVEE
jgi:hypothetical protein